MRENSGSKDIFWMPLATEPSDEVLLKGAGDGGDLLDGLVGATVAVIADTVPPEHWRLVAAEFSGRRTSAIDSNLKTVGDSQRSP